MNIVECEDFSMLNMSCGTTNKIPITIDEEGNEY